MPSEITLRCCAIGCTETQTVHYQTVAAFCRKHSAQYECTPSELYARAPDLIDVSATRWTQTPQ